MKAYLSIFLILLFKSIMFSQNSVKINVFILGKFDKNEKYVFEYNEKEIHVFKPVGYDLDSFYVNIDTLVIKNYTFLPLKVFKVNKRSELDDTHLRIIWEANKTILLIERDFRLKDEYGVSYRWLDKKRDVGISAHLYDRFMYPDLFHSKPKQ